MCESDIPTLSDQVMEYLERMAKNETTAARFFDARNAIMELHRALRDETSKAVKRYRPRKIVQDDSEFMVFVIPSVWYVLRTMDIFCIIYREADARFHVLEYANCNSIREYENSRSKMFLKMQSTHDLDELLNRTD